MQNEEGFVIYDNTDYYYTEDGLPRHWLNRFVVPELVPVLGVFYKCQYKDVVYIVKRVKISVNNHDGYHVISKTRITPWASQDEFLPVYYYPVSGGEMVTQEPFLGAKVRILCSTQVELLESIGDTGWFFLNNNIYHVNFK